MRLPSIVAISPMAPSARPGEIVVHRELAGVPALHEAVGGPAADAVDGRLDDVDASRCRSASLACACIVSWSGTSVKLTLMPVFSVNAGKHLGGVVRIAGPAHDS